MRNRGSMLITLLAAALLPAAASAQTWTEFQVGGVTRKALVYAPSGINNPPLLMSFHGMGIGASWNQGAMMKFEPIADRERFIVVYPEADQDLRWDLGGTHDIDFVLTIIDEMSRLYGVDRDRVYASGFSMGGMFSYTLACKIPDRIAAIAPGNGYPLGGESGCTRGRPVPIFHMHGTADDFVAYSGIHSFLGTKIAEYGCPAAPVVTDPYPPSNPESKSFKEYWGPCVNGNGQRSEVILASVTGMIHDWATAGKANTNEDPEFTGKPFDIDGSEEAWAFLKNHSLSGSASGGSGGTGAGGTAGAGGAGAAGGAASCAADPQNAYQSAPANVPGTVQAEDFDTIGYFDTTTGNEGGAYRADVDADIKPLGAGYAIGWMTAGEWLEYTVDAAVEGDYRLIVSAGAVDAGRTLEVSTCGTPLATVRVPEISAWGEMGTITASPVHLAAGLQVVRISVGASDFVDLDAVTFELMDGATGGAGGVAGNGGASIDGGTGASGAGCRSDADCDDADPCTTDTCNPSTNLCVNPAIPTCLPGTSAGGAASPTTDAAGDGTGCGCRVGGRARPWAGTFALLALLVVSRRARWLGRRWGWNESATS